MEIKNKVGTTPFGSQHTVTQESMISLGIDQSVKQDRERSLLRKVSKVSILQTARKIENDRVLTEQRLIPLTQQTKITLSEANMAVPSSTFASRVPRDAPVKESPGPGDYQTPSDIHQ